LVFEPFVLFCGTHPWAERFVVTLAQVSAPRGALADVAQPDSGSEERTHPLKIDKDKYDNDGRLKNGVYKEYFKDGTLSCAGKYSHGEKAGQWKYYLRNGVLRAIGRYSGGKMTGEWKWYRENGKLMQTGSFEDEKKVGIWKRYHRNGALYDEGEYVNDKKAGEWRTYDANGKLTKATHHKP
jgi:hypothetical protein